MSAPPSGGFSAHIETALWMASLIWIVGMATVFPLGNPKLEAVSVFTFDRLAFLAVGALALLASASKPSLLRPLGRVEATMALYLGIALVSWANTWSGKQLVDLKRDADLLLTAIAMPFTAYLVARHARWTPSRVHASFWVIVLAVGLFLVAVGFVQSFVDWQFLVRPENQDFHASRARGPFSNAVPYGVVVAMLLPITLSVRANVSGAASRWLLALLAGLLAVALVLAQVRVVWGAVLVAMLFLAASRPSVRRSAVAVAVALTVIIGLALAGLDPSRLASEGGAARRSHGSIRERMGEVVPVYDRVAVYATALNMIAHRPAFGFGFGNGTFVRHRDPYYASCCGVSPEWAVPCMVPHNEELNQLILMGGVGLAAYVLLLREIWRNLSTARADTAVRFRADTGAALQSAFVLLVVVAQLHDVMYLTAAQALFFFSAGLMAPVERVEYTSNPAR